MNLAELKIAVDGAIAYATECGELPHDVIVTLQIDGPETQCIFSTENVELHYDNNMDASGCVLTAYLSPNAALTGAEGVRVEGTVMQQTGD